MSARAGPTSGNGRLDARALAARILALQDRDGRIRWIDGGLWDPWCQTESAMGLAAAGETRAAARALDHLAETQGANGAWIADMGCAAPLTPDGRRIVPEAPQVTDTNFAAYAAVGVWHLACAAGGTPPLRRWAPMVERALGFALDHQRPDGAVVWRAPGAGERIEDLEALRTGSCSIYKSLECGVRIFDALGRPADRWRAARARLGAALRRNGAAGAAVWAPKGEFAMDWYYPVLAGVLPRRQARARLAASWRTFVEPGWGCRCVAAEPWVTAAETAELAIALAAAGARGLAGRVLATLPRLAAPPAGPHRGGDLWMGWQTASNVPWPEERPSWTAGVALIAEDVLRGGRGARVFLGGMAEE